MTLVELPVSSGEFASVVTLKRRTAIFLDQLEDAMDATHSKLTLTSMDGIAYGSDVGSRLVRTGQQLEQL